MVILYWELKNGGNMEKKVALVTGASRGIGKAIAIDLAKNNYFVVINYCNNENAAKEVLDIVNSYSEGIIIKADVSNIDDINSMCKQIKEKFNETSDILDMGDWNKGPGRYYAYAIDFGYVSILDCWHATP